MDEIRHGQGEDRLDRGNSDPRLGATLVQHPPEAVHHQGLACKTHGKRKHGAEVAVRRGPKHGIGCGDHHAPDRERGYFAFQDEREPDSHEPEKKDRRNEPRDAQHHAYVPGCMGFLCLGHVAHSQARACELRPELLAPRRAHVRAPPATCLSHHPQTAAIAMTAIAMSRNAAASAPPCKRCLARNVVTATITERQPPATTTRWGMKRRYAA